MRCQSAGSLPHSAVIVRFPLDNTCRNQVCRLLFKREGSRFHSKKSQTLEYIDMPSRTIFLPPLSVTAAFPKETACTVGPSLPPKIRLWRHVFDLKHLIWWLLDSEEHQNHNGNRISRGYAYQFSTTQGAGELEVLRWNPFQDCVMLLNTDSCRIALSVSLSFSNEEVSAQLNGECEVSGWRSFCLPVFGLVLNRRYRKIGGRLERLLIRPGTP